MFDHYAKVINDFVQTHHGYAQVITFLVAFAESLPVIGTIIPGSITMTMIGILVGRNLMPLSLTLFLATTGALTGDYLGFWLGRYYDDKILKMWPFRKYPHWIEKGEKFFEAHGGKSILIGRFIGPTRSAMPMIAGILKMGWGRFTIAVIPSAFMWAVAYLLPGILIGAISLEIPKGKATEFTLIGLLFVVIIWLIFWAIQRFFVFLANFFNNLIDKTWDWLSKHHASKLFIRIITNKNNPEDHHQLTLAFLGILCFLLFLVLFINVIYHTKLTALNSPVFHLLQSIRHHDLNIFFIMITLLGSKSVILIGAFLVAIGAAVKRQRVISIHIVLLILCVAASVLFFKHVYFSARPIGFVYQIKSSSFPSGHTTCAVAIYGFLGYLCTRYFAAKFRWIPGVITAVLILLVALSRLYLGAHWLTDIFGAMLLGSCLLFFFVLSYRRQKTKKLCNPAAWFSIVFIGMLVPWGFALSSQMERQMYIHTPYFPKISVTVKEWWQNPTEHLPTYRLNRFGNPIAPFNLQWAAPLSLIKDSLKSRGWVHIIAKKNVNTAIRRFASNKPEQNLPLFAQLYRHQPPALIMIKHLAHEKTIIELRLWKTGVTFTNAPHHLWIGSVNYHKAPQHSIISLNKKIVLTLAKGGGIKELTGNLKIFQWKLVTTPIAKQPKEILPLEWNGKILVVRKRAKAPANKK